MAVTYSNRLTFKAGTVLLTLAVLFVLLPGAIPTSAFGAAPAAWAEPVDLNAKWTLCPRPGKFITCLCPSKESLWVGAEDTGLWQLDLSADPTKFGSWQQMSAADGPGANVYALAVDAFGRLWAGTLNRGVSVYNGSVWKTYGPLAGCPGERVFSIAADPDPQRGRVWIATDRGLTCWTPAPAATSAATAPQPGQGLWHTFTQADGLPSAQIYAVAVARNGRVWAGTECDGLAWSDPPYKKWTPLRAAAERNGDAGQAPGLSKVAGFSAAGLPSNLTNALRVLPDGTVVYATNYGLGLGRSGGQDWASWQGLSGRPYENYIRGLAPDPAGGLWLATVHKGLARLDRATGRLTEFRKPALPEDYIFDAAVTKDGRVWAGTYGSGLAFLAIPGLAAPEPVSKKASQTEAALPDPPAPPALDELNAMLAALAEVPIIPPEEQPAVVRLDDDWLTKGDCLGRYGRYWGCWCAICSPEDYLWGAGPEKVEYCARIGPNTGKNDSLRYWVHWLQTMNPNSLEMPPTYCDSRVKRGFMPAGFTRREAEWDDHGEAYPLTAAGPGLYCTLKIPAGLYYLSLYNFNKDGHGWIDNRLRDFRVSVRTHEAKDPLNEIGGFEKQPELARARMRDFWGGAYKRFLVHGPTEITVNVNRNHSFNTILAGVFLDLVEERPVPYGHTVEEWKKLCQSREAERRNLQREAPDTRARRFAPAATEAEAAARLFEDLERMRLANDVWWAREGRPCYAALLNWTRARMKATPEGPEQQSLYARAATCFYHLGLYERWEAGQTLAGLTPARQIEKGIRWDGVHDFEGKGFQTVCDYLKGESGSAAVESHP